MVGVFVSVIDKYVLAMRVFNSPAPLFYCPGEDDLRTVRSALRYRVLGTVIVFSITLAL